MKMLFGCGVYVGFRGSTEHAELRVDQFKFGTFESGPFAGERYVGVEFDIDKTHHLGVGNGYARDSAVMSRFPIDSVFGGTMHRFLSKCVVQGQKRLYVKISRGKFMANCPLGHNIIRLRFKKGAKILNFHDPDKFAPHSLRAFFIS